MHKRYSIHRTDDGKWELRCTEGVGVAAVTTVVGVFEDGLGFTGEQAASAALGATIRDSALAAVAAPAGDDGVLLPEEWSSVKGIAFSERLPGGRDFTDCAWSWRDPVASISPLMLLTEETEYGHLGAVLCGFSTEFTLADGTVDAKGRFYNSDDGIRARDILLAAKEAGVEGFGVSVGPTENLDIEYDEKCVSQDEDGFCDAYELTIKFVAYEIGSLTMCTPAGFEGASIAITGDAAAAAKIKAGAPTKPPATWFSLPEPKLGEPFLNTLGDEFLVEQDDGIVACPVQISPPGYEGLVFGNLATWGQCHPGMAAMGCVSPPPSTSAYAHFHTGHVLTAEGADVATGPLTVGCDHAPHMDAIGARDHYAHAGLSWADVHVTDGEYGPWVSGVLRPGVTEEQLRMLRALSLSGDWVLVDGELDLVGALAVNTPGYPINRTVKPVAVKASVTGGVLRKLTAANVVRRCPECEKRAAAARAERSELAQLVSVVKVIERRTRHLIPVESNLVADRIRASVSAK